MDVCKPDSAQGSIIRLKADCLHNDSVHKMRGPDRILASPSAWDVPSRSAADRHPISAFVSVEQAGVTLQEP